MVFDPVKHQGNRRKFLHALYDIEQEDTQGKPMQDVRHEDIVGDRAGLTREESDRISSELLEDGLIEGVAMGGLVCNLTREGLELVEQERYDRTLLAKRRKAVEWAKDGSVTLSKEAFTTLCSIVAGLGVFATFKENIVRWLKHTLGH